MNPSITGPGATALSTGYSAAEFAVDTSGFSNALNGRSFTVAESGNDLLQLGFIPAGVPEPPGWIASAVLSALGVARWKWQRAAVSLD